jgi:hypothetical protein
VKLLLYLRQRREMMNPHLHQGMMGLNPCHHLVMKTIPLHPRLHLVRKMKPQQHPAKLRMATTMVRQLQLLLQRILKHRLKVMMEATERGTWTVKVVAVLHNVLPRLSILLSFCFPVIA